MSTLYQEETQLISSLDEISENYDAILCDLWGCFHNGVAPYPAAVAALRKFRARGGVVTLFTNAPRPHSFVRQHLGQIGAPDDAYDMVVSSGDATRLELERGKWGRNLHIIGPVRDDPLWSDLDVRKSPIDEAEAILCTGLFDDTVETPEDYAEVVAAGVERNLPFLCANPDVIVDRGETRIYCAGAIAQAYEHAGGATVFFGKPHRPIYELALESISQQRGRTEPARVLAVGDGVATDVLGAEQMGLDCLFVTGGLAAVEIGGDPETPQSGAVAAYLTSHNRAPRYAIGRLR